MKHLLHRWLLLTLCCFTASHSFGRAVVYHLGIYSLGSTDNFLAATNYDSAYIAGGAVRVSWAKLEPSEGVYDWSFIDHEIATASSKGKHISIFFGGAFKSPSWLLNDAAIHFFVFRDGNNQIVKTPLPYDSVYLSKLCRFISAFGARFRDSATIAYVRGASESVTQGWGAPGY